MAERIMKNSGVEWIGKIPSNWDLKRLKLILNERNEKNDPVKTDNILSLGLNYGVIPYSEREISGGNKAKEDLSAYKLAYPNDIVMNSMNVISGSVGISNYYGCVSPVYYMFYPRNDSFNIRYYNMMFQSKAFQRSLLGLGNGIMMKENDEGNFNTVRMRIPLIKLNNLLLPIPPKEEQARIANFLDKKVSEIDAVISKTKESIEEYKKLKQSIITEAVTKGLDPNVEMKDSGIEEIGTIPIKWNIIPLKYLCSYNDESLKEETDPFCEFDYIDIGSVEYGKGIVKKEHMFFKDSPSRARRVLKEGDIVVSTVRTYLKAVAEVQESNNLQVGSTGFIVIRNSDNVSNRYLKYSILADYFINAVISNSVGISYPAINAEDIVQLRIAVPCYKEQNEIATYLDEHCSKLDSLISKKEQIITELEQYKKSLIYEYVTGKKEVA